MPSFAVSSAYDPGRRLVQPAGRDMRRLDPTDRQRVYQAIHHFADTGSGDVKRLRGSDREWRLRVGNLRVLPRGRAYR